MRKMSLSVIAALLLLSGGAQVTVTAGGTAEDREQASDTQASNPGKMPNFWDPAIRLLMWIQQNEGLVSGD